MKKILRLSTSILLGVLSVTAQEPQGGSQEELSAAAANPLANLMSFPFQNNLNMNYGEYNRNMNILNSDQGKTITRDFHYGVGKLKN